MTSTPVRTRRDRLIGLARWVGAEKAMQDLGLPSEWDQDWWLASRSCGTTCCIAGKVALEDGGMPAITDRQGDLITDPEQARRRWATDYDGLDTSRVLLPDGTVVRVDAHAQQALGLTDDEARWLFNSGTDYDGVIECLGRLLADNPAEA